MSEKYPFTLIKEEIAKRKGKALDFAVGIPPFPLSPDMSDWLKEHSELALIPGNRDDIGNFASAAARFMSVQYGVETSPDQILPTAGGRAAMAILAACTLSPSSTVVVTEPGYPAFARIANQLGASIVVSHLDRHNGFAPDFEYTDDLARGSVTMLAVNYPNNPSGSTLSPAVLEKLHSLSGPGLILFNDATYGPLVYDDAPRSLLSEVFPESHQPDIVELHSFSKLYPIGPLAVSFLAGSKNLLRSVSTYSEYAWSPLSRLQLEATARCLEDRDRIRRFREYLPKQLESLQVALAHMGFKPYDPHSGTYVICDVPQSIAGNKISTAQGAAKYLMDEFDIAIVPLGNDDHSYLRFSALYRPHDLERLVTLESKLRIR
ncbi:MAG: pyridoxal phosphate-dependent aminotransferase [Woeseiaceae bacterium]